MELITPKVEIWQQGNTLEDMWKHIARCTRVCYQSTPKENGESDEAFVKRVILHSSTGERDFEKLHGSMLEHCTVYLTFDNTIIQEQAYIDFFNRNPYSTVVYSYDVDNPLPTKAHITTNLRVLYENNYINLLDRHICNPSSHKRRITVSFTTNIGVSREFNRHRVNSIAEESTRYCNYNKRNSGQLKIGLPAWLLNEENLPYVETHQFDRFSSYINDVYNQLDNELLDNWCDIDFYLFSLTVAQWSYNMLIKKGWKPQQAREVLPLATKTQLIHTAFIDAWKHFFALRADGVSGYPHPNAALLAKPLKEEFIKLNLI